MSKHSKKQMRNETRNKSLLIARYIISACRKKFHEFHETWYRISTKKKWWKGKKLSSNKATYQKRKKREGARVAEFRHSFTSARDR